MEELIYGSNKALLIALLLAALPVGVATLVGLLVGIVQTITQLQEASLPFGLKVIAVIGVLLFSADWLSARMLAFANEMFALALR
ncbi:type III secretion system export apparatus subunit SctS [Chitinasiproducens palmae]|uniref:Type III secretion protein S n=1 Tax=Chitinasiproducens palmae TaxID=1770053 RepID=A0A1H2PIY0_9BURK|nr:type III secretion system export apparatus subunit SctS [Chitinasiproducens palmae]SDV46285.1 type III secretion protein S [Chitinasiproducens palmae]